MSYFEVLRRITQALDSARIPYMLTGSFASAYYGSMRSTQDIDLIIEATPTQLQSFLNGLAREEYYADVETAIKAQMSESVFNIIDIRTGWKIDMIIRKSRAFSREEFSHRQRAEMQGVSLFVASAEDMVLAKLEWAKLGESRRQIEDAATILKLQDDRLDRQYLGKWARELGLSRQWDDAQRLAKS